MGDQMSCCDARTQLDNTNTTNALSNPITEGYSSKKLKNFSLPPMSSDVRSIIEKAEKSKYFKPKPTLTDRIK